MIVRRRLEYENTHLKRALKQRYSFPNIIGKSERMVRMWTWWPRWLPAAPPS